MKLALPLDMERLLVRYVRNLFGDEMATADLVVDLSSSLFDRVMRRCA
jgi:hypothetical protein